MDQFILLFFIFFQRLGGWGVGGWGDAWGSEGWGAGAFSRGLYHKHAPAEQGIYQGFTNWKVKKPGYYPGPVGVVV